MAQTKDQRTISKITKENENLVRENALLESENILIRQKLDECKDRVAKREKTIEGYQEELNKATGRDKMMEDPSNQTIQFCVEMMKETFSKISCPVTRSVVFKEFVKEVIDIQIALVNNQTSHVLSHQERLKRYAETLMNNKEFLSDLSNTI